MKLQRISLEHIAKIAGVHKATVSRALRNHPTIPTHTRERIHEIARREGYRPNPLIALYQAQARASLPTTMQSTLAWLNDYPNPTCWRDFPWLRGYLSGAQQRSRERGFRLEEVSIGGNSKSSAVEVRQISESLRQRGIFGVILPLMLHRQFLLEEWSHCVVALVGSGNLNEPGGPSTTDVSRFYPQGFPIADRDFYFNLRLSFQTVLQRGYLRVGFIYSRYLDRESEGRAQAAFLVEQSQMPEARRLPILFLERFKEGRPSAFDRWFDIYKPDVILSINPVVREWLRELGSSVPEDCGLVNLNVVEDVENWSGIRENHRLIGAAAVDLLIGQLSRGELGRKRQPRKVLIPGEWHEGGTLRPLRSVCNSQPEMSADQGSQG